MKTWRIWIGRLWTKLSLDRPVLKSGFRRKLDQVPHDYFLPRRSVPSAIAIYGAIYAAGFGAWMLLEVWIKEKMNFVGCFFCVISCNFTSGRQQREFNPSIWNLDLRYNGPSWTNKQGIRLHLWINCCWIVWIKFSVTSHWRIAESYFQ